MHMVTISKRRLTSMIYHTAMNLVMIPLRLKDRVITLGSSFLLESLVEFISHMRTSALTGAKLVRFFIIKDSQLYSSKTPSRQIEDEVSWTCYLKFTLQV